MNFKKVLSIASVASIAVVGLVSCGKKDEPGALDGVEYYSGTINLALNYKDQAYLTYGRGTSSKAPQSYTTVDGKVLTKNSSTAAIWQDIQSNLSQTQHTGKTITFADAALAGDSTKSSMKNAINAKYVGNEGKKIDILQITTADEFVDAVNNGDFVNLDAYKDYLPNLYKWFSTHEGVYNQMKMGTSKGVYYTPYFDGVDQVEKGISMNAQIVRSLLDDAKDEATKDFNNKDGYDTATTLKQVSYTTPYITDMNNQTISVLGKDNKATTIQVTITEASNVITLQNALDVKNGENLVTTLKNYLLATYGNYISTAVGGKASPETAIYDNLSEIFVSNKACYNADELIALLRCVKTNPEKLTGSSSSSVIPVFPRTAENNRASIFFELSQIFGLRGTNGEKGRFWYNESGKLVDTITQEYALDCIDLMHDLQDEQLFPTSNYWMQDGSSATNDYRKVNMKNGTCFMTYDYSNVAAYNADAYSGSKTAEMQGVLPPVAKWPLTKDGNGNTVVGISSDGKYSYTRFTEDNRSLKDGGWSIVNSVASDSSKLKTCLYLLDYMYTEEGSFLECYSYNEIGENKDQVATSLATVGDTSYPVLTDAFKTAQRDATEGSWHYYMTMYLGSCLGVGNIRSNYLESQLTGSYQEVGTKRWDTAIAQGVMYLATTGGKNFLASVPTTAAYNETQSTAIKNNAKTLNDWWAINKNSTTSLWESNMLMAVYSGWSNAGSLNSKALVKAQYNSYNNSQLAFTATVWGVAADSSDQYTYLSAFRNKINA